MAETRVKIATCHTCHWPIYQGDLIHHSSTGSHSGTTDSYGVSQRVGGDTTVHSSTGTYGGISHSDQWVQCQWCLNEYGKEYARLSAWKWKWGLIIWLTVPIIICLITTFISSKEDRTTGLIVGLLISLMVAAPLVWWIAKFFAPKANRYRFRAYRK